MVKTIVIKPFLQTLQKISFGTLNITTPENNQYTFEGKESKDLSVHLDIRSWDLLAKLKKRGSVGFAEAYRDGLFECDDLVALTIMIRKNDHIVQHYESGNIWFKIAAKLRPLLKPNNPKNSVDNIHAHYDIGNTFYQLWLDKDMHYSSALFQTDKFQTDKFRADKKSTLSLEQAQNNKCLNIIDQLKPSGNLLEIGCGWGGFAELSLKKNDYAYKGITISDQQLDYARRRLKHYDNAEVAFEDYREQKGLYENIVSIEMFEAVGERYWSVYFDKIKELLHPKGRAVIQTITVAEEHFDAYRKANDPIRQFVFPGGLLPSFTRFKQDSERAGLKIINSVAFGKDYAKTLSSWLTNFEACLPEVYKLGFDEAFVRIWRFYLAICEGSFASSVCNVHQIHIEHS